MIKRFVNFLKLRSLMIAPALFFLNIGSAIFVIVLFFAMSAQAGYSETPVIGNEKILITLSDAQVVLIPQNGIKTIKLRSNDNLDNELMTERRDNLVIIKSRELLNGNSNSNETLKRKKELELIYPSQMALDIHLFEGTIIAQKLQNDSLIHVHKGKIIIKESQAQLMLHVFKGEIQISDTQGKVSIDSYAAQVNIKNSNFDSDIQNFSGETHLEKLRGFMNLTIGSGSVKILQSAGTLQFENSRGSLTINNFNGRIDGQIQDGGVNISTLPESEINLRSQAGRIQINTLPGAGVALNIATSEGEIYAPNYLKVSRLSSSKSLRARTKGDAGKGSIFIRSQSGIISIK